MTASTDAAPDGVSETGADAVPAPRAGDPAAGKAAAGDPTAGSTGGGGAGGKPGLAGLGGYLPGRREALFLLGGGVLGAALAGGGVSMMSGAEPRPEPEPEQRDDEVALTARQARARLEQGNARYIAGQSMHPDQSVQRREGVAQAQHPFAAILSCADSRVPPETLFDQGLGDLFVVRSAGQVIDHAVLGSLQYGVEHLTPALLVVLGHSGCGAVKATIEALDGGEPTKTDVDALITAITPAVKEAAELGAEGDDLLDVSIQINVERIVESLKQAPVIGEAASMRAVKVIGAVYDLTTGELEWL